MGWSRKFWLNGLPEDLRIYILDRVLPHGGAALASLSTLLMGGVLCVVNWQTQQNSNVWIWLAMLFLLCGVSYALRRAGAINFVLFIETLIGALWVIAVLVFFPAGPNGSQLFFVLVLMGAGLSAAIFQHAFLPASLATIGVALPTAAFSYNTMAGNPEVLLVLFIIAGWMGALGLAWFLHNGFLGRTKLLFERTALLQSVESKVEELDHLRKMEQASRQNAEDANAAKSRFFAHASHDLRQPLHAIGLLLATIPDNDQNKQNKHVLDRIKQSLDVLSDLFDALLDVALLDTGQVEVNISKFSLGDILKQVGQDFDGTAKQNGIRLRICPSSLVVRSDPMIVRRMVQNLVSNAIAHAHDSRVLVGARRRGASVCIEVHDTGDGIAIEDQNRIFEEFTKVGTRNPKNDLPGLGLGLAIVQRLAKIIDAKITLKSEVNAGSVFRVEDIERAFVADAPAESGLTETSGKPASTARIAILDDDAEILKATESLVEKWGFNADCHTKFDVNGLQEPDIILCDYELLQDLNGVEVIAAIRSKFGVKIPAVLITGNNSEEVIRKAKSQNLSILYKPVKPAQLRSVLLTALSGEQ